MRDLLKATRRVETRSEFIGERLILHEGIVARSADCLDDALLRSRPSRVGNSASTSDAIPGSRAIVRPDLELLLMQSSPPDAAAGSRRADLQTAAWQSAEQKRYSTVSECESVHRRSCALREASSAISMSPDMKRACNFRTQ
jgi:hypothetical protein